MSTQSWIHLLVLMLFGWTLAGCGSKVPPPTQKIALTQAAINQAEASGAVEFAPVEMRSAREKLTQARTAMNMEDNKRARQLAEQAEVDAKLAEAKARTAKSQKVVAELQESINTLKMEIERKVKP